MSNKSAKGLSGLVILVAMLQVWLGLIAAGIYLSSHNTLYNNGNWTSTKTALAGGIIGAQNFVFNLQPLAGGHLNLSGWFGYQEVVSKEVFDPASVEFDFRVTKGGHLTFELNRTERTFNGIRISASEQVPPAIVKAAAEGEFLRKRPFVQLRRARDQKWHRLRVDFEDEKKFTVVLDGKRLKTFAMGVARPQRIGFRGSVKPVYIDNVVVVSRDSSVFSDSFDRPTNWRMAKALAVMATLLVSAGLFLLLHRFSPMQPKLLLFYFLTLSIVLVVIGLLLTGITWHRKKFYPNASEKLRRREATYVDTSAERMIRHIEDAYTMEPIPGVQRLLFIGSSQTRGSGALSLEQTLVRRTERLLNDRAGGTRRVECLNAAVRGYGIERMRQEFEERWVHWKPAVAILNAGSNDRNMKTEDWVNEVMGIVRASERAGIRLVVIHEPNSAERPSTGLSRIHSVTREIAAETGIPIIDMHDHLSQRFDDGFLWWDWVHLTSFGQEAFSEHLADELMRLGLVQFDLPADTP